MGFGRLTACALAIVTHRTLSHGIGGRTQKKSCLVSCFFLPASMRKQEPPGSNRKLAGRVFGGTGCCRGTRHLTYRQRKLFPYLHPIGTKTPRISTGLPLRLAYTGDPGQRFYRLTRENLTIFFVNRPCEPVYIGVSHHWNGITRDRQRSVAYDRPVGKSGSCGTSPARRQSHPRGKRTCRYYSRRSETSRN